MFNKDKAKANYEDSWMMDTADVDAVLERIETMSKLGAAELCVYNDSTNALDGIRAKLVELDFDVTYHNGETEILLIEWGT